LYERKDAFYRRAKREGFRSRAAYKLEELQREQRLLRPGDRVADLGCWPGGWMQVAAEIVGPAGRVVGIDLDPIDPLPYENAIAIQGDLTDAATPARILEALGGVADAVLSDAAPKLTGVRATDRAREEALLEAIEALLPALLRPGGTLVAKLLDSPEAQAFAGRIKRRFASARVTKSHATRKGSSEKYLIARDFRLEKSAPI
jgi:23S rRNA (uridine2552-2'-O)-methyltransferase